MEDNPDRHFDDIKNVYENSQLSPLKLEFKCRSTKDKNEVVMKAQQREEAEFQYRGDLLGGSFVANYLKKGFIKVT